MVFNSLFGMKQAEETAAPRSGSERPEGLHRDIEQYGLSPHDQDMAAEQQLPQDRQSDSLSEAEARILKSISKGSFNATEDENWERLAGFSLGIGSLYVQEILSYPVIVIRRQCQVNHTALKYHMTPFSVFQLMVRIQRGQGTGALWKGWGTSCVVQGIVILTEVGISELMHLPRDLSKEESVSFKAIVGHQILKCLGIVLTLPFYSASLVDSVQSQQLDESRSLMAYFKDVFYRLAGWYSSHGHGRLLPLYSLIAPTLLHGMLHYIIKSLIERVIIKHGSAKPDKSKFKDEISIHTGKTYYIQLLAGFVSTIFTDLLLFPLETIIIRLHIQGTRTIIDDTDNGMGVVPLCTNYDGVSDCAKTICRDEGAAALFKGLGALFIQCIMQACILKVTKAIYKRFPQSSTKTIKEN